MTSLADLVRVQLAHTHRLDAHKPKLQALLVPREDISHLDQLPALAISHQAQLQAVITQLPRPLAPTTPEQLLDSRHQVHLKATQAPKVPTQAPALAFPLPTCHHSSSHKASHPRLTLLIHHRALHRNRPETICHRDEDKFVQTLVYITLLLLSPQVILMSHTKP
jgi:hypothetical protein